MTDTTGTTTQPKEYGWVLLELMGHRQRIGLAREEEVAGGIMLRIDVPTEGEEYVTEFYGSSSIYAMRPISEEVAKLHWSRKDPRPVKPTEYRQPQIESDDVEEEPEYDPHA